MFSNVFKDKKNERLGLLLAVVVFALIGMLQLWRAFAGLSVELDGHSVPLWISAIVGIAALLMAGWMAAILHHNRPIL